MTGSRWDALAAALPRDVFEAVKRAGDDALHQGGDLAAIDRAALAELLRHVVLRTEHDRQVQQVVNHQRATFEAGQEAARTAYENGVSTSREAQAALARVWRLVDRRRKTVRMDDLRAAINGQTEGS